MVANMEKKQVAVGYVRYSGESDDAHCSVAIQKRVIEDFAAGAGVSVMDWYVDQGYGGEDMERPGLQQVLVTAQSGDRPFDVVLVWGLSRLSRNQGDAAVIASLLQESGVGLVSVAEPDSVMPASRLLDAMQRALEVSHKELHAERVRRGIRAGRQRHTS